MEGRVFKPGRNGGREAPPLRAACWNAALVALFCATLAIAHAQQRDAPASTNIANAIGTARVSGTIVTADAQHQPLRGAIVTMTGSAIPVGRSSITDDTGKFVIDRLPAGRYTLVATKPAYLTSAYGATRPSRPGVSLLITDGQRVNDISIAMPHGAAISGVVTEVGGQPASAAQVSVMRLPRIGASLTTTAESVAFTDDRGIFRVFGLSPGDYVVAAEPRAGRVGAVSTMASSEIDATLAALRQQRAGSAPVDRISASATALPVPRSFGVAPTFFPGVSSAAQAQHVTLGVGDDRSGVDIPLAFVPMASIAGVVVAPDGSVPTVRFYVNSDAAETQSMQAFYDYPSVSGPAPNGTFTVKNITPGRYSIVARTTTAAPARGGGPPVTSSSTAPILFAVADVTVDGSDVTGLALALQPSMRLTGKVAVDQTAPGPPPDLTKMLLRITDVTHGVNSMGVITIDPATIRADGTFEAGGLVPGTYRVSAQTAAGSTFSLRSAVVGGKDVLDTGLDVRAGADLSGAVITLSDRHASLTGKLQVPADQTPSSYFIVVYPSDRSLWRPQARRIQMVRPGSDGTFLTKDLPGGEYYVAALTDVEADDLSDPAFFDALIGASAKVTIADGEQTRQDLRIGG